MLEFIGEGCFGKVARCQNLATKLKIVKNTEFIQDTENEVNFWTPFDSYDLTLHRFGTLHQSMSSELLSHLFSPQVSMLELLSVLNPDRTNIVKFFEWFEHQGQTCLAFEMLDRSLYDLLQERDWKPLSLSEIRTIAKQVCIFVKWN